MEIKKCKMTLITAIRNSNHLTALGTSTVTGNKSMVMTSHGNESHKAIMFYTYCTVFVLQNSMTQIITVFSLLREISLILAGNRKSDKLGTFLIRTRQYNTMMTKKHIE